MGDSVTRVGGSKPMNGSSSRRSFGLPSSAFAILDLRVCPLLRLLTGMSRSFCRRRSAIVWSRRLRSTCRSSALCVGFNSVSPLRYCRTDQSVSSLRLSYRALRYAPLIPPPDVCAFVVLKPAYCIAREGIRKWWSLRSSMASEARYGYDLAFGGKHRCEPLRISRNVVPSEPLMMAQWLSLRSEAWSAVAGNSKVRFGKRGGLEEELSPPCAAGCSL